MQTNRTIHTYNRSSVNSRARRPTRVRRRVARSLRNRVAQAFRALAVGVEDKSAYAHTVAFYCSSGQEWTKQFG